MPALLSGVRLNGPLPGRKDACQPYLNWHWGIAIQGRMEGLVGADTVVSEANVAKELVDKPRLVIPILVSV
jgi:hypothetical protein